MFNLKEKIQNAVIVRFVREKSQKIILPGFNRVPLYDVVMFFVNQVKKVGLNERAQSISFSFLTAIPAATIFLCTLIPYLPIAKEIKHQLLLFTKDITPNLNTYTLVKDFLDDFLDKPRGGLLSFGFLLAIFYASNAMLGIMRSFNKSLIYNRRKNFLQMRWMAIKLTVLLIVMMIATFTLLVTNDALLKMILKWKQVNFRTVRWMFKTLRWVVIVPLFYFAIAFIYKYAPAVHKRWRLSSPGTLLATFLFVLTSLGFSFWVNNFSTYNKIYGSIGTILILMLLIYFNAMILLIGYELNVSIHHLRVMADEREEHKQNHRNAGG